MMRVYIFTVACCLILFTSCVRDNGPLIRQDIPVTAFHKLEIKADADVCLIQDSWFGVVAEGSSESLLNLDYEIVNNKLIIRDRGRIRGDTKIVVYVPDLSRLEHDCDGEIYGESFFVIDGDLEMISSGNGRIDLAIVADELEIRHRGNGEIYLEGEVIELDVKVSDSGDYSGFNLFAEEVKVKISNSGNAEVHAEDFLDVQINDSGNVYFTGRPDIELRGNGPGELIDVN